MLIIINNICHFGIFHFHFFHFFFFWFSFADIIADSSPSPSNGNDESVATDQNGPIASIDEMDEIDQFVKPSKIHVQPLHADDLLYESKKFDPSAGEYCMQRLFWFFPSISFRPITAITRN